MSKQNDDKTNANLNMGGVTPRYLFDEGIKYAKELAEAEGSKLSVESCLMIAKEYAKHVNHFLKNNVG